MFRSLETGAEAEGKVSEKFALVFQTELIVH